MKRNASAACLFALLFAASCSKVSRPSLPWLSPAVQSNPTAEALFNEGMEHFENKRYTRAIDRLQRVKAEFPFSPQFIEAELRLAEAYYLNKQYPEAIAAFREFQTLHPTHERIPFVIYHLGMAHFDQFTSADRDQRVTEIARGYFKTVLRNHPNSPYAQKAREKLAECEQYLAEHEFHIARFYFNKKGYAAAIDRFEDILRRYPNSPVAPQALYLLGESYQLEKNTVKSALAYRALNEHYPRSPFAEQAEVQLAQIEKQKVDPLALLLMPDGRPRFAAAPAPDGNQPKRDLNFIGSWFFSSDEEKVEAGTEKAARGTEPPKSLPESVLKSPAQAQLTKPAEKGVFDKLKQGLESIGNILNPFKW